MWRTLMYPEICISGVKIVEAGYSFVQLIIAVPHAVYTVYIHVF